MSAAISPVTSSGTTRLRWSIYAMEAALLGTFMISACAFALVLFHPRSPVVAAVEDAFIRRLFMGMVMGATAIALIYSRLGKRSGAHMNPAVTLANLRLGRISRRDAVAYIAAQFIGAIIGVGLMSLLLRGLDDPAVNFVATVPGATGPLAAWAGEFALSFLLMTMVQTVNRRPRLAPFTGWFAGMLVCIYITFESPISGMSINPARTFGSAVIAQVWTALWVYFTAPVAGMLLAIEVQRLITKRSHALCCKLSHCPRVPCVIPCNCVTHSPNDASHQTNHE